MVVKDASELRVHPICRLFPDLSDDEFRELVEDIRVNGQRVPIGVYDADWGGDFHNFDCHVAAVPQSNFVGEDMKQHPAQKPVSVFRWLINALTQPGDLVCDPFCGSGALGITAVQLKRRYRGIEIEPKYLELAKQRILLYGGHDDNVRAAEHDEDGSEGHPSH